MSLSANQEVSEIPKNSESWHGIGDKPSAPTSKPQEVNGKYEDVAMGTQVIRTFIVTYNK